MEVTPGVLLHELLSLHLELEAAGRSPSPDTVTLIEELSGWKDIPGFSLYQVKECGCVRNKKTGRVLKWRYSKEDWYPTLLLYDGVNVGVHQLVALAFLGKPPRYRKAFGGQVKYKEVNHKNLNKTDPSLSNLEYATHQENSKHAALGGRYGKKKRGTLPP